MANLVVRSNDALQANPDIFHYPVTSDINITSHGSDWYWAVCAVMIVSTFAFVGLASRIERRNRIFHYITASITMVAAIAYFTLGSNLGYAATIVEFQRSNPKVAGTYREIFYVRYIDWVVTTPLLLLDLMLTAGLPTPTILYTLLVDEIMIITGLVGALVASSYKWGYFVFAMFALFFVAYNICYVGLIQARHFSKNVSNTYRICGTWTIFLWFLYPIAWGLSEGGNVISPDSEAVFYGILDILAKPVFGALLIWGHRNIDPAELGLIIHEYADGINGSGLGEKRGHHNGISNGSDGVTGTTTTGTANTTIPTPAATANTTNNGVPGYEGTTTTGNHPTTSSV